jgi:LmbE family N-acetylglucosaminyl deacetylase
MSMSFPTGREQRSGEYDVVAFGAHPDDLEAVMGGTSVKLVQSGRSVLYVDLCGGEPARYAERGVRHQQALKAAEILGVDRITLSFQDRVIVDSIEARMQVAMLLRKHRPKMVFTTLGSGVHPDHKAVTDIVVNGIFYARLPKWNEVPGGEYLEGTDPHEIEWLFFGHCRMEPAPNISLLLHSQNQFLQEPIEHPAARCDQRILEHNPAPRFD